MVATLVGVIALIGAASFAPRAIPAAAPPVRLDGYVSPTTVPAPTELVVVPTPSVDLEPSVPVVTSTTLPSAGDGAPATTVPTVSTSQDDDDDESDEVADDDDTADSPDDGSADSPDDD